MIYGTSLTAVAVFGLFVAIVLAISFYLGARAKTASGYYAAHGGIPWFVNGIAFAGDYLSAASFLGICGLVAFYGYDGFLYSIGYLAGWVVALFVIAEPLKRMGRFTFADALDKQFNSRGIKLAAAISTLVVSTFYLIPQMVGAGALVQPLLGFSHEIGVLIVGVVVIVIVVTAGMVSTTWVQFIKGSLLVIFCGMLVFAILARGLVKAQSPFAGPVALPSDRAPIPPTGSWKGKPYARYPRPDGGYELYRIEGKTATRAQAVTKGPKGTLIDGLPLGSGPGHNSLQPVGHIQSLPNDADHTGSLGPVQYLSAFSDSTVILWPAETPIVEPDGSGSTTIYYQKPTPGKDLLVPGAYPPFKGVRAAKLSDKLDFLSLMIALFGGTASLPHILIRYYTVKDQAAARKSTVVGIASIGLFYMLTLYLGLGAMTGGTLDPTNNNMAAPLLAKSFGALPFAVISAIAFTTVLGTVSGLILAASGAVVHDLMTNVLKINLTDKGKVNAGKVAAVFVGAVAMVLGIVFKTFNVTFLVGWAFNVAASANLPALVMLLFWKRTTKQGITAAIITGMCASLAWILCSAQAYKDIYHLDPARAPAPFSQPGLVTIPLGFVVLVVVSLLTRRHATAGLVPATVLSERGAIEDAESREPGEA
jgi:cation/acetate symporter